MPFRGRTSWLLASGRGGGTVSRGIQRLDVEVASRWGRKGRQEEVSVVVVYREEYHVLR